MSKFKVGDRVLATDNIGHFNTPMPGTIVRLFRSEPLEGKYDYLVRFDDGAELWSNVTNRRGKCLCLVDTDFITSAKPCKFYDDGTKAAEAERRLAKLRAAGKI